MEQDVYADLLFLINFSMDYLCLYISLKVLHRPLRVGRMLIAAALGGVYAVLSLFWELSAGVALGLDLLLCLLIAVIAFAEKGRPLRSLFLPAFLFLAVSMMTGGCMTAIFNLLNRLDLPLDSIGEDNISAYLFAGLAALAGLISLKSGQLLSRRSAVRECTLTVTWNGKTADFCGFADTGNLVKDPLTGKPVILLDKKTLAQLVDPALFEEFAAGRVPQMPPGAKARLFRVIPIRTAGGQSMLVACDADGLVISAEGKKGKQTVSVDALIAPAVLEQSAADCTAVIPAELLKNL